MTSKHEQVELMFWQASQMASNAQRRAFLDDACGDDLDLRREVEELLGLITVADALAENYQPTMPLPPQLEMIGEAIGPYKLREKIGEGGFGIVYIAEQEIPIRRCVAIKLIKPGMDSREIIARFEAERQALALMDHHHIAQVFDAGTTDSGRPYFVMELVKGIPITDYAENHALSLADRLGLMKSVCEAVEHAHQRGIIHRDLKPSNVMVTLHDGVPIVKVIDFGVAKALHAHSANQTVYTALGQMLGTPMYMSPEQAELSGLGVDTRSDVYSLGVLLYELLTGMTPFDRKSFHKAGLEGMLKLIRESEPQRPSLRVSTANTRQLTTDDQRQVNVRRLHASLRGELDWIVMKALEKQRERRYQSARDLAKDLDNYLANQPVEAGPPSWVYRASKFARRNRVALGVVACSMLALASILGSWMWVAGEQTAALRREGIRLALAATELRDRQDTITNLVEKQQWDDARSAIDELLAQPDAILLSHEDREKLTSLIAELRLVLSLELAQVRATHWTEEGFDYRTADQDFRNAFSQYGVTIGDASFDQLAHDLKSRITLVNPVATALDDWALATHQHNGETESYYKRQTRAKRPQASKRSGTVVLDNDFSEQLLQLNCLLDENPLRNRIRSLAIQSAGLEQTTQLSDLANDPLTDTLPVPTLRLLVSTLRASRQPEAALELLRRVHIRRPDDFWINYNLFQSLPIVRNSKDSERLRFATAALAARPQNSAALNNVGATLHLLGRYKEAQAYYRRAFEIEPTNLFARTNLALLLMSNRKLEEATQVLEETLRIAPEHAPAWAYLSVVLMHQNQLEKAAEARQKAITKHHDPTYIVQRLIIAYTDNRLYPENVKLMQEAVDNKVELYGDDLYKFGTILVAQGKFDTAIDVLEQALQMKFYEDIGQADTYVLLGKALRHEGRDRDAFEAFQAGLELTDDWAPLHDQMARLLAETQSVGLNNSASAVEHARRAIELFERDSADDFYRYAWQTLDIALTANEQHVESLDAFRKYLELGSTADGRIREQITERALRVSGELRNKSGAAQARELCLAAIKSSPQSSAAYVAMGMMVRYYSYDAASHDREAIEYFRGAIQADPSDLAAHEQLSRVLSNAADPSLRIPDEALEHIRFRISNDPNQEPNAYALATLGMAQYRVGQLREAIESLSTAYELPAKAIAPCELFIAMAYWQLDEQDAARRWYELTRDQVLHRAVFQHIAVEAGVMIESPSTERNK